MAAVPGYYFSVGCFCRYYVQGVLYCIYVSGFYATHLEDMVLCFPSD